MQQPQLFLPDLNLPNGMVYESGFLSPEEEAQLISSISTLPLHEAQYREWTARRRVASFGGRFDFSRNVLNPADPVPPLLHPLRERIAAWSGIPVTLLTHALVAEYSPGTQLGWHRDVPDYDAIVGVSLAGWGRMRLRPCPPRHGDRAATLSVDLQPRSVYSLRGSARRNWQHAISPTRELRYSITFRTLAS